MPIYEYKCSHCDKIIEKMQAIGNSETVFCDNCHNPVMRIYSSNVLTCPIKNVRARMNGKVLWEA
jgi:putative FmdB family regulatory protein